jgi:hypothetical protein
MDKRDNRCLPSVSGCAFHLRQALIAYLHKTAFANGLNDGDVGPLADAIAIALHNGGFNEGEIIALFERE